MVNVGIIGGGFMAHTHGAAYQKLGNRVQIYGVAAATTAEAQGIADKFGARIYNSAEELMADPNIHVIDICVPTHLHIAFAISALQQRKHVLCEKPLTISASDLPALQQAVQDSGKCFMVGQVVRFWSEYEKVKEVIDSGALGKMQCISAARLATYPNWSEWFKQPEISGGALFDLHLHDIDYLRYLCGKVQSVYCVGQKSQSGAWDHIMTTLSFDSGVRAVAEASYQMPDDWPFTALLRVTAEKGVLEYSLRAGSNIENLASAGETLTQYIHRQPPQVLSVDKHDPFDQEIAYFISCVEGGVPCDKVPLEESVQVIRILQAAKQSLETGQVVHL